MTREQAIENHRKMWNWIADEIEYYKTTVDICNYKKQYCIFNKVEDVIEIVKYYHSCFLCYYTKLECKKCPLKWESEASSFMCEMVNNNDDDLDGLWIKCHKTKTWQEQAELARKIASLPERKE